jgi:hypothetical protein
MGGASKSKSSSTQQSFVDSYNKTVTGNLGSQALGVVSEGPISTRDVSYLANVGNTSTTTTSSYGAGSPASGGGAGGGEAAGLPFDFGSAMPFILGGVGLLVIFLLVRKK